MTVNELKELCDELVAHSRGEYKVTCKGGCVEIDADSTEIHDDVKEIILG